MIKSASHAICYFYPGTRWQINDCACIAEAGRAEKGRWAHTPLDKVNQDPEEVEHLIALKDVSTWAVSEALCGLPFTVWWLWGVSLWHGNSWNKEHCLCKSSRESVTGFVCFLHEASQKQLLCEAVKPHKCSKWINKIQCYWIFTVAGDASFLGMTLCLGLQKCRNNASVFSGGRITQIVEEK